MLQNDYLIRQIDMMIRFVAGMLFKKDTAVYRNIKDEKGNITDTGKLCLHLRALAAAGKIGQAEDLLFSEIESSQANTELLEAALDFYGYLNEMPDAFLEDSDFSRAEISQGFADVKKIYGLEEM